MKKFPLVYNEENILKNKTKRVMNFGGCFFPFPLNFYFLFFFYSGSLEVIDPILLLIFVYIIYFIWITGKQN